MDERDVHHHHARMQYRIEFVVVLPANTDLKQHKFVIQGDADLHDGDSYTRVGNQPYTVTVLTVVAQPARQATSMKVTINLRLDDADDAQPVELRTWLQESITHRTTGLASRADSLKIGNCGKPTVTRVA
jgi:hypothetical protein